MVCIKPFIKSAIKLHAQNSKWILKSEVEKAETFQILQQTQAYFITRPTALLQYQDNWSLKKPQKKQKTNQTNNQNMLLKFLHR